MSKEVSPGEWESFFNEAFEHYVKKSKDEQAKTQRLQAAVKEMLYEINIHKQQENEHRICKEPLDTLETYGLTKEDME